MRRMRIFLAVFPPPAAQAVAARAIEHLRTPRDGVAWVKRDNLHYTLRFLAELDELSARAAGEAAREAAATIAPFGASLGGFGAFPSARLARTLWIGISQGAEPLRRLADALEAALIRQRFGPAEQPFEPHLTVGRLREPADWTTRLIAAPTPEARFTVDRLLVVRSTPARGGTLYEPLASAALGGE